eukprot:CAMPEP_0119490324 /NCGR_PEP_ID=MMETSP1344-20130328/15530_1 /TAXON_ID=236787 /ORGANISM="Florenciella parvula, Strain CCMP2471" /LENGTH=72 /DNA_ID=CAMNT_0007525461 /DNA_START=584 /DNA_END=797 /DNA_ORIENTATION=-
MGRLGVGARVAAYAHRQDADVASPSPPSVAASPQCSPYARNYGARLARLWAWVMARGERRRPTLCDPHSART